MPRKTTPKIRNKNELPATPKKRPVARKKEPRVARTRNCGTQTEASFWTMVKNGLRRQSMYWKPISKCKEAARRPYIGPNKRQKWEYQCVHCEGWFIDKDVQVDHIVAVGSIKCYADLPGYVERLFCETEGLQVLCSACHSVKTAQDIIKIRTSNEEGIQEV